jgi:hypothetical protein
MGSQVFRVVEDFLTQLILDPELRTSPQKRNKMIDKMKTTYPKYSYAETVDILANLF